MSIKNRVEDSDGALCESSLFRVGDSNPLKWECLEENGDPELLWQDLFEWFRVGDSEPLKRDLLEEFRIRDSSIVESESLFDNTRGVSFVQLW